MIRRKSDGPARPNDPLALSLEDLEPDRPSSSRLPRQQQRSEPPPDFPPCPAEYPERTWRLTRQFVEAGDAFGVRRISPWFFAKEFAATVKNDHEVMGFIQANGFDLAENIFSRMIRLFWTHYVDSGTGKRRVLDLFLDQYWADLFDQAKLEYTTDLIQKDIEAGTLKVSARREFHSLMNDTEYQATLQDLLVEERLTNLQRDDLNGNAEPTSGSGSGKVSSRGASSRGDTQ